MLPARRALSGQRRATNRLSCRVDSSRTQRAVIGNKLEKIFQCRSLLGGCYVRHQLPFRSGRVHRCAGPDRVRQPCSNLVKWQCEKKDVKWRSQWDSYIELCLASLFFVLLHRAPRRIYLFCGRIQIFTFGGKQSNSILSFLFAISTLAFIGGRSIEQSFRSDFVVIAFDRLTSPGGVTRVRECEIPRA